MSDEAVAFRIRLVDKIENPTSAMMTFSDPSQCYAVSSSCSTSAPPIPNTLDVLFVPISAKPLSTLVAAKKNLSELPDNQTRWFNALEDASRLQVIHVKLRGAEISWRSGRAILHCDADQTSSLLMAIMEFNYFENELRKIESEIAAGWADLEADKKLVYEVKPIDLERSEGVRRRVEETLQRRIRHARVEARLYTPGLHLTPMGEKLGEELREKACVEDRSETVDSQLEVFEHIYEMCSQRMGEFRDSRQGHTLEWVIIILLGTEVILLIADLLWQLET